MNYYIYKIINKITGHYYIGCRMTKLNIHEDEYFGSGVGLLCIGGLFKLLSMYLNKKSL